jgi:hypothetical protein
MAMNKRVPMIAEFRNNEVSPLSTESERPDAPRRNWLGSRAARYQIPASSLPLHLDAGIEVLKLGEEACVPHSRSQPTQVFRWLAFTAMAAAAVRFSTPSFA